ncbi:MAG: M23 family metallopeptidase [Gemmatimonadaceae bacterium]|nr:M23 family metallopeptidase [Gemmatimonadaceae bacterium]
MRSESAWWLRISGEALAVARPSVALLTVALLAACGPGLTPLPGPADPAPDPMELPIPANPATAGAASAEIAMLLRAKRLMVPVDGISPDRISDTFTARRGQRIHSALDIMAPRGTRVLSVDAGKVWKIRSNNLGGLTVYAIDSSERFVYYYAHLDRYAEGLAEGQTVQPGDMIGYVGTTGNAPLNAPHLHFQLLLYRGNGRWWDGEPLNPRQYLARAGRARSQ